MFARGGRLANVERQIHRTAKGIVVVLSKAGYEVWFSHFGHVLHGAQFIAYVVTQANNAPQLGLEANAELQPLIVTLHSFQLQRSCDAIYGVCEIRTGVVVFIAGESVAETHQHPVAVYLLVHIVVHTDAPVGGACAEHVRGLTSVFGAVADAYLEDGEELLLQS